MLHKNPKYPLKYSNTMPNKKEKGTLNQQEIAEWRKAGKHTVTDNGVLYCIW